MRPVKGTVPVFVVPEDRETGMGHLDTDLVRPAGDQADFHKAPVPGGAEQAPGQPAEPGVRIGRRADGDCCGRGIFDQIVGQGKFRFRGAPDDRMVDFFQGLVVLLIIRLQNPFLDSSHALHLDEAAVITFQ